MKRTWTDQELAAAIAISYSWKEVARQLSLSGYSQTPRRLRARSLVLHLDTSHFQSWRLPWTDDQLIAAVTRANSLGETVKLLGYASMMSSHYATVRKHIERLGLSTDHWYQKKPPTPGRKLEEYLVENGPFIRSALLKYRLLQAGLKQYVCEECNISEWRSKPLVLELDHMNGNSRDNRLVNLRLLCPNCHSQTPTHSAVPGTAPRRSPTEIMAGNLKLKKCIDCNKPISDKATRCQPCNAKISRPRVTKIAWPATNILVNMLRHDTWESVGRRLGVSSQAVKKHLRSKGVDVSTVRSVAA